MTDERSIRSGWIARGAFSREKEPRQVSRPSRVPLVGRKVSFEGPRSLSHPTQSSADSGPAARVLGTGNDFSRSIGPDRCGTSCTGRHPWSLHAALNAEYGPRCRFALLRQATIPAVADNHGVGLSRREFSVHDAIRVIEVADLRKAGSPAIRCPRILGVLLWKTTQRTVLPVAVRDVVAGCLSRKRRSDALNRMGKIL